MYARQSAPGYGTGPICWKCRGAGRIKSKRRKRRTGKAAAGGNDCTVCGGRGSLNTKRKEQIGLARAGKISKSRPRPKGWEERGPSPFQSLEDLERTLGPGEEACLISGKFRLLQRAGSHRFSTDDLACAVRAFEVLKVAKSPSATRKFRYCDLGCGIGVRSRFLKAGLWNQRPPKDF